ncbi:hypothetical protein DOY81_011161, partial [Sarcophaga bullata]
MMERSEDEKNSQDKADIPTAGPVNMEQLRKDVLRLQLTMESLTQQIQTYITTTSTMVSNVSLPQNSFEAGKSNGVFTTCQPDIITQQHQIFPENKNNAAQRRMHEQSHTQPSDHQFLAHDNKRSPSIIYNNLLVVGQQQNVSMQNHTKWPLNTMTSSVCVQSS